jgi:hypothetical protein
METINDVKTAQHALDIAQAACTKAHQEVASLQARVRAAERAKNKADQADKGSTKQLAALSTAVANAQVLEK